MIRTDPQTKSSDPADTGLQPADDGQMWLDARIEPQLQQAGLTDFDSVMATFDGRCLRALTDRENWRLSLQNKQQTRGAYLKKHHVRTWLTRLRARLGTGPGETSGRVEAHNVGALTANGIEVMRLMAYGEKLHADGLLESFVLTEELEDYTDLHTFLHHRFPPLSIPVSTAARDRDLAQLIREVARVARRFHQAGFNHRDLYCGHFYIRESVPGEFHIRLIDLQRVQHRRRFRRRWIVKDLAQLAWSAPRDRIKCTDKLAFMRCYLGVGKLRPADKRLIRAVLAKQRMMQRRLGIEA